MSEKPNETTKLLEQLEILESKRIDLLKTELKLKKLDQPEICQVDYSLDDILVNGLICENEIKVSTGCGKYVFSRDTVSSKESLLKNMLNQSFVSIDRDSEGYIVFEKQLTKHFHFIAQFLRRGDAALIHFPVSDKLLMNEILVELEYFGVFELLDHVNRMMRGNTTNIEIETEHEEDIGLKNRIEKFTNEQTERMISESNEIENRFYEILNEGEILNGREIGVGVELCPLIIEIDGEQFVIQSRFFTDFNQLSGTLFEKWWRRGESIELVKLDREKQLFIYIHQYIINHFQPSNELLGLDELTRSVLRAEVEYFNFTAMVKWIEPHRYPIELLGEEFMKQKEDEDIVRTMFAKDPDNPILKHPHLLCTPILHCLEKLKPVVCPWNSLLFDFRNLNNSEPFKASTNRRIPFEKFDIFTSDKFKNFDWYNVVIAGGFVLYMLKGDHCYSADPKQFKNMDIDLFLYGLNEKEAIEKVKYIQIFLETSYGNMCIVKTGQSITFQTNRRVKFQIILRLYKSITHILCGFDIDCCCAAFDGSEIYVLPRFIRAVSMSVNVVDVDRQSTTYEYRLQKYARRLFRVCVAGFSRHKIQYPISINEQKHLHGLAKLLWFENRVRTTWNARASFDLIKHVKSDYETILPEQDLKKPVSSKQFAQAVENGNLIQFSCGDPNTQTVGSFFPMNTNFLLQAYSTTEEYMKYYIRQYAQQNIEHSVTWIFECMDGDWHCVEQESAKLIQEGFDSGTTGVAEIETSYGNCIFDYEDSIITFQYNYYPTSKHKTSKMIESETPVTYLHNRNRK